MSFNLPRWISVSFSSDPETMILSSAEHQLFVSFPLNGNVASDAAVAAEELGEAVFDKEYPEQGIGLMRRKWEALADGRSVSEEDSKMQARHDELVGA